MIRGKWSAAALLLAGCASGETGDRDASVALQSGVFEGRVVDDLGKPLSAATVKVLGPATPGEFGDTHQSLGQGQTDRDGRFALVGIPHGPCVVWAEAPGCARLQRLPLAAPARGVVLVCPRWGRVAFRLVPPPGETAPPWADLGVCFDGRSRVGGWRAHGTDGVFEEGDFAPGSFELNISCPGWAPVLLRFTAEAGRTVNAGEIPLDRGHTVKGCVVDEQGAPIEGARVDPENCETPSAYTDADGMFRMDHLPRGEVMLWASATGYVARRFPVQVAAVPEDTRVALQRGGVIHVRIRTRSDGMPYSCWIRVVNLDEPDPGGGDIEGQFSGGGVFELSRKPGRYRVDHLRGSAGPVVASREVNLEIAAERSVEFVEGWE